LLLFLFFYLSPTIIHPEASQAELGSITSGAWKPLRDCFGALNGGCGYVVGRKQTKIDVS